MTAPVERRPSTAAWFFGALPGFLPMSLAVALNWLRPDLLRPMIEHAFGYVLASAIMLACMLASALYGFAFAGDFKKPTSRALVIIGTALALTLPTIFAVLFGPIVFAFMYGNV